MAELNYTENKIIESFLKMESGFVLDFSDKTLHEFIGDATKLDINSPKYHFKTNSKANRLRCFIKVESNIVVGNLIKSFCEYWHAKSIIEKKENSEEEKLYHECLKIANKLSQAKIVEELEAIKPNSDDKDFAVLARSIKESIEKHEPEVALDRLHTFVIKYLRQLCINHNITFDISEPIHSLLGKYIKYLRANKLIESEMSENILKYSINIMESFNDVRNNKSFAHDNPILNYNESILIFNNISNIIKFIETIENTILKSRQPQKVDWNDLPF